MSQVNANINPFGGNKVLLAEVNASFALVSATLTAYTNCADLGAIESSQIPGTLTEIEKKTEDGKVSYASSSRTIKSTAVLQERHKSLLDFLAFTVHKKTYIEYKYLDVINGKHQEMFSIVNVQANIDISFEGGTNTYTATRIVNSVAVTITAGDLVVIETGTTASIYAPGPVVIPAGQEFVIIETAV